MQTVHLSGQINIASPMLLVCDKKWYHTRYRCFPRFCQLSCLSSSFSKRRATGIVLAPKAVGEKIVVNKTHFKEQKLFCCSADCRTNPLLQISTHSIGANVTHLHYCYKIKMTWKLIYKPSNYELYHLNFDLILVIFSHLLSRSSKVQRSKVL